MHHRLTLSGYQCNREIVRLALKSLDPEGVDMRKTHRLTRRRYTNPGPNYLWHLDGNDKLKPFGLGIHRCIDGYSRRILWLEVSRSNKDPTIVGKYFLDCIHQLNSAPRAIRVDRGVENTIIAGIQRYSHNSENSSFCLVSQLLTSVLRRGGHFFVDGFCRFGWIFLKICEMKDYTTIPMCFMLNVFSLECAIKATYFFSFFLF